MLSDSNITSAQILEMLELQDSMNREVNPHWIEAGYCWPRAIMMEAAEAIDHHGWKWWKHTTPDMPQLQMELVDIWHFMLSMEMENRKSIDLTVIAAGLSAEIESKILSSNEEKYKEFTILECLHEIIAQSAQFNMPEIGLFGRTLQACGMSWDDLYFQYIGKNALNKFRQANGYKTGDYIKDWSSVSLLSGDKKELEDNDHLSEILRLLLSGARELPEQGSLFHFIGAELALRYSRIKI